MSMLKNVREGGTPTKEELKAFLDNPPFDVEKIRKDFAYLESESPIIYLDNAATTQRPRQVLDRLMEFYSHENANPLRGNHRLSLLATEAYEKSRKHVQNFINAKSDREIIFTRNTTESLNLVSYVWALNFLKPGDRVLVTRLEHHSNSVNWQFACQRSGAQLDYVDIDDDYCLDMDDLDNKLTEKTKVFAFTGASNVVSTINDIKKLVKKAHEVGAIAIVDAAQYAPHESIDVQDLDCDFLAFSGHKMFAPFGIGVLYGKEELLEKMPPFLYGGEMIEYVYDREATYAKLPYKFEAGTQNVGGAVGLDAALTYIENIGIDNISNYENALAEYCAILLRERGDCQVYRPVKGPRGAAVAFNLNSCHPHDLSSIVDASGLAIRAGHHCTQQLHKSLCLTASCRASFAFYNTIQEVDLLMKALDDVKEIMGIK